MNNDNQREEKLKIGRRGIYRIVAAAACILVLLLFLAAVRSFRRGKVQLGEASKSEQTISDYTLRWLGTDYTGTYTGQVQGKKPGGEGLFETADFSYQGEWNNGVFDGKGVITYSDGTWEEGSYMGGKRHSMVRQYSSAAEYKENLFDFGKEYGNVCKFKDGKEESRKLIANGDSVKEIKKEALELTEEVISEKQYADHYVYVTGTVQYVVEDEYGCSFRMKTDSIGMVTGSFDNTSGKRSRQEIMPNLEKGDRLRVYGFYAGLLKNGMENDSTYYGFNYFAINPVYGEIVSDVEYADEYEGMCKQPYLSTGRRSEREYIVETCIKTDGKYNIFAYPAEGGDNEEIYVLYINGHEDDVFYPGQKLFINGFYAGQYKVMDRSNIEFNSEGEILDKSHLKFDKYPRLTVISFEVR